MTPPAPLQLPTADEALAWVRDRTATGLAQARELVAGLREDPPAEPEGVLRRWDEVTLALSNVGAIAGLYSNAHPDLDVRTASEEAEIEVDKLVTELRQDRALFDVFAALDPGGLDPTAARLLEKTLEEFRRAGVDQDDATRARLAEISERITVIDQEFSRNIRDDVRTVKATPEQLAGLPEDWLAAHPVDDDGWSSVTTDYPDAVPARMFVRDREVRRRIAVAFLERGWPAATSRCSRSSSTCATSTPTWSATPTGRRTTPRVKMIEKGPAIPEFIDRIAQVAQAPMERDLAVVMERFRQDVPDADSITSADSVYYEELVRKEQHDVDSQRVRTYFEVREGEAGAARRHRPAVRPALRAGRGRSGVARGRHRVRRLLDRGGRPTARAWAGSTSTCIRARGSTSTPRSSRSPTGSPAGSCPRVRCCATSARG